MLEKKIGNVRLYVQDEDIWNRPAADEEERRLLEIIQSQDHEDYHAQITAHKSWTIMYQLAESRANLIGWLRLKERASVLEVGAGCGTITSALLEKGASVTCQEENIIYCRCNALRHKACPLVICAAPLSQCETQLDDDYDVITVLDVPLTGQDAEQLLHMLRRHLKPDGMLVIAAKNKFGLKYWAGNKEMYTHTYFAGLENNGVRLYSKEGLSRLLRQTGFEQQEFYYPYPDERFALDIYSDRYLPKKGDLNYNIVNYEDDRMLLFDEQKVFDSIIEEEKFPFFANAFLCLAGAQGQAVLPQETVYARYACDRSRKFAVCTQITGQDVRKYAVYPQGAAHIGHILQAYEKLSCQYAGTRLRFNRCIRRQAADGSIYAEFELLHAKALQEQVEQAVIAGRLQDVSDTLRTMIRLIRDQNQKNSMLFEMTDAFRRVFGKDLQEDALQGTACSEISDIDLILPNILTGEDGTWHVIDYEWTFFFPVPQNFIIYRTLFFLNHENPHQKELSMERLLEFAGISQKEAVVYAQMEAAFQQYVTGGLVPYREMVNLMKRRYFDVVQLKADYDRVAAQNELLKGQGLWKAVRKIKKKLTGS